METATVYLSALRESAAKETTDHGRAAYIDATTKRSFATGKHGHRCF